MTELIDDLRKQLAIVHNLAEQRLAEIIMLKACNDQLDREAKRTDELRQEVERLRGEAVRLNSANVAIRNLGIAHMEERDQWREMAGKLADVTAFVRCTCDPELGNHESWCPIRTKSDALAAYERLVASQATYSTSPKLPIENTRGQMK